MREFEKTKSRAAGLSFPARVLYTVYAAITFIGLVSVIALYDRIVVFSAHATPQDLFGHLVNHYVQPENVPTSGTCATPSPYDKLLETTHAHLFTMPVMLLIAGHLFLLTSLPMRVKTGIIVAACAAMVLHLLAPWIIYATNGEPITTTLYPLSGGALLITTAALLGVPVWEMWRNVSA